MTDLNKELTKVKAKLEKLGKESSNYIANYQLTNIFTRLLNIFAITAFGTEEQKENLKNELEINSKKSELRLKNKDKGYLYFFDETAKPASEEFGCPHCGGYVYEYFNSICEAECEYEGKPNVYCPKIECDYGAHCQSTTLPLGCCVLNIPAYLGIEKDQLITIQYKGNFYVFRAIKEMFFGQLTDLIRKFFNYDLTRKEMNNYLILISTARTEC